MDILIMKQQFTTLVRPYLVYGNVIWHLTLRKDEDFIEAVQHQASLIHCNVEQQKWYQV